MKNGLNYACYHGNLHYITEPEFVLLSFSLDGLPFWCFLWSAFIMPGTKSRTKRRRKRKPPSKTASAAVSIATPSTPPSQPSTSASQRKPDSDDDVEEMDVCEGHGMRLLELQGLQLALEQAACCKVCNSGRLTLREDLSNKQGLFTKPYLFCEQCAIVTSIPFSTARRSKIYSKTSLCYKVYRWQLLEPRYVLCHLRPAFSHSQTYFH